MAHLAFAGEALHIVSGVVIASIYFLESYFDGDSKSTEGRVLIFFLHSCFQFLLVAFLPSRRSPASFNLSPVHALSCQVALGLLFGAGFMCFVGFMGFLFVSIFGSWVGFFK